jgi:hypothetical protein
MSKPKTQTKAAALQQEVERLKLEYEQLTILAMQKQAELAEMTAKYEESQKAFNLACQKLGRVVTLVNLRMLPDEAYRKLVREAGGGWLE